MGIGSTNSMLNKLKTSKSDTAPGKKKQVEVKKASVKPHAAHDFSQNNDFRIPVSSPLPKTGYGEQLQLSLAQATRKGGPNLTPQGSRKG